MPDIYLLIEGQQKGPYSEDQIRQYLDEGRIHGDMLAWRDGLSEWVRVSDILTKTVGAILPAPPRLPIKPPLIGRSFSSKLDFIKGLTVGAHRSRWVAGGIVSGILLVIIFVANASLGLKGVYRTSDNSQSLTITSGSELEVRNSNGTFPGTYKLDGDALRIELTESGTPKIYYFKKVKQGWQEDDGTLYLSPTYFEALQLFRQAHDKFEKDDFKGAIADYTHGLESNPNDASAYEERGWAKHLIGDKSGALADWKMAIQIDPESNASTDLAEEKQHQQQEIAEEQRKKSRETSDPTYRFSVDQQPYGKKRLPNDDDIKTLQQAVKNSTDDTVGYTKLGVAYLQLNQFDDAIGALNTAKNVEPSNAKIHNYLGCAYAKLGQRDKASDEFCDALRIDIDFGDAHFNYALLCATVRPTYGTIAYEEYSQAIKLGERGNAKLEELIAKENK